MKKLILLLCLVATGMVAQTTTTQTINSKLKLTNVPAGTANDTLLVRGADKVVKKLPKADLFATIPTPTLSQVTMAGASTGTPLDLNSVSTSELTLKGMFGSSAQIFYRFGGDGIVFSDPNTLGDIASFNYGTLKYNLNGNTSALDFGQATTNRTYTFPDLSGTVALKEYTVGDFINDNATTMAPSQNAVYDALATKVGKTGNETISGTKSFSNSTAAPANLSFNNVSGNAISIDNGAATGILLRNLNNTGTPLKIESPITSYNDVLKVVNNGRETATLTSDGRFMSDYLISNFGQLTLFDTSNSVEVNLSVNDENFYMTYYDELFMAIDLANNNFSLINKLDASTWNLNHTYVQGNKTVTVPNAGGMMTVIRATAPASATAAGVIGEIFVDANYIYYCYAPNSWRRVASSTW